MAVRTVIIVLQLASELSTPGTTAMQNAAQQALGQDIAVTLEVGRNEPDQVVAAAAPDTLALAWLGWDDQQHRSASLRVYLARSKRWVDADLEFSPRDPEWERGRTIGFLVASIVLERTAAPRAAGERPVEKEPSAEPDPAPEAFLSRPLLVRAAGSAAGPGDGRGFGGWLGVEYLALPWLSVGGFGEGRFGTVADAQASSQFFMLGPSATWYAFRPSPWWFALRGSAGVTRVAVERDVDNGSESQARIDPMFGLAVQFGYSFSSWAAAYGELGGEVLGGRTEIAVVDDAGESDLIATFPLIFPVARAGVSLHF